MYSLVFQSGLWENFRQLWLQDNGFTAIQISNITSIATLISVFVLILVSKCVHLEKLKSFVLYSLIIKFINLIYLYFLNKTGYNTVIGLLIIVDIVTGYMITTSIYPLITTVVKNNAIYSKRKLTEYLFRDIGILVGGIFIGKYVFGILVNYNICLFISVIFLSTSILVICNMTAGNIEKNIKKQNISIVKYVLKSKIQILYTIDVMVGTCRTYHSYGVKNANTYKLFKFFR